MYIVNTENRATQTITTQVPWEEIGLGRRFEYRFKIFKAGANADMTWSRSRPRRRCCEEGGPTDALYEWEDRRRHAHRQLPARRSARRRRRNPQGRLHEQRNHLSGRLARHLHGEKEGTRQLYVRRNHTDTAWVSEPEGTNTANPENVTFNYITLDNKHIIFTTTSPLVDEDVNGETDLYMYTDSPDPENESNLTLISSGGGIYGEGSANPSEALLGASDDGSIVYFQDNKWNIGQIWQYKEGQRKVVLFPYGSDERRGIDVDWGSVRVSRDGKRLVMVEQGGPVRADGTGLRPERTEDQRQNGALGLRRPDGNDDLRLLPGLSGGHGRETPTRGHDHQA